MHQELLGRCRAERIEPPTAKRADRTVRSALHASETATTARIAAALPDEVTRRLTALVAADVEGDGSGKDTLSLIKSVPGNVSLECC